MEAKKFISTVKGFKTRFGKTPNTDLEKKQIDGIVEKFGGKLEAFSLLKSENEELLHYVKSVLGMVKVSPIKEDEIKVESVTSLEDDSSEEKITPIKKTKKSPEEAIEIAASPNGKLYEIDTIKKTCHKVISDFSELAGIIEAAEMSLVTYQRYLKDRYFGETVTIKKGKLLFRGYRVSCTQENGFMVEDTMNKYKIIETAFEGIPTPAELGDFFEKPRVEHSAEEVAAAIERGKEAKKKVEKEVKEEPAEIDFELLRKKVLSKINFIITGKVVDFDPQLFPDMIPFKRWQKAVKSLLGDLSDRRIRYKSFLSKLDTLTREETFEKKDRTQYYKFVGTCLPEFKVVGNLCGSVIMVDGKNVEAVPFLQNYLLHYCPDAMSQLMKFAKGEIEPSQLLKNPIDVDKKVEFNSKVLKNTPENAQILSCLFSSVDVYSPHEINWESGLNIGDKILVLLDKWSKKEITKINEEGTFFGREVLLKSDKWIKLEN